jgi:predicted nucleic-acid-binding protein
MEPIATVVQSLLHDELITVDDQQRLRAAIQQCRMGRSLLLWVTCPRRRSMTGRELVRELAERMGKL